MLRELRARRLGPYPARAAALSTFDAATDTKMDDKMARRTWLHSQTQVAGAAASRDRCSGCEGSAPTPPVADALAADRISRVMGQADLRLDR